MTSTTRGPLPASVYWRRRLFVLGTVLALVLIAVNVVRGDDAPVDRAAGRAMQLSGDATAPTTSPSAEAAPAGTAGTKGTKNKGSKKKNKNKKKSAQAKAATPAPPPPAPVLVDPVGQCADDDISVIPAVSGAVAGRDVNITLRVRTLSTPACTWRISANHLAVKISSGDEEVWASRECPRKITPTSVVVRQAVSSTVGLTWNSRVSDTGCPALTEYAQPGLYDISVTSLGGEPASASFTLAAPVARR